MDSNLPQEYNETIFDKIKNFFSRIFAKKEKTSSVQNTQNTSADNSEKVTDDSQKTDIQILREETIKDIEKEELIKKIQEDPSLVSSWPIEKLRVIEKIFDEKIAQCEAELARLNENNS